MDRRLTWIRWGTRCVALASAFVLGGAMALAQERRLVAFAHPEQLLAGRLEFHSRGRPRGDRRAREASNRRSEPGPGANAGQARVREPRRDASSAERIRWLHRHRRVQSGHLLEDRRAAQPEVLSRTAVRLWLGARASGAERGLAGMDLDALGIPSEEDYVAAYCRRTGRDHLPNKDYLVVFCLFRLAAILHGIKGRLARGNASSAHAAQMVERLEPLAELAWSEAQEAQV